MIVCVPIGGEEVAGTGGTAALWASVGSIIGVIAAGVLLFLFVRRRRRERSDVDADGEAGSRLPKEKKKKPKKGRSADGADDEELPLRVDHRQHPHDDRFSSASRVDRFVAVMTSMSLPKDKTTLPSRSPYHHDHQIFVQRLQ